MYVCKYVCICLQLFWHIYRKENDIELDILNTDVFLGIDSKCLYFSVESIEFDLPGT